MTYKGYDVLQLSDEELAEFYEGKLDLDYLVENEYLILKNTEGRCVDKYVYQKGTLEKLSYSTIKGFDDIIKPRNTEQELAFHLLQDPFTKIKLLTGVAGSGKDFLMFNQARHLVDKGKFSKIAFCRPNVTVGDVPDIGYLPSGINEKLAWTMAPLYDKVGGEAHLKGLIETGTIELVPLLFIRGRSFENSIIYITEGQNMTPETLALIVSRLGSGSELWINADTDQIDKKIYKENNGVKRMIDRFAGQPLFGYVELQETERSEVAKLAKLLY